MAVKFIFTFLAVGIFFICIWFFTKKVYNYADVKDNSKICSKCGGELQDYKEFEKEELEKKNREFQKLDKIEREFIEKHKKE